MSLLGDVSNLSPQTVFGTHSSEACVEMARLIADFEQRLPHAHNTSISSPLRDRLLSVYFPDRYLPVADDRQLDFMAQALFPTLQQRQRLQPEGSGNSRQLLYALYQRYPSFSQWSLTEYAWFLTHYYPLGVN